MPSKVTDYYRYCHQVSLTCPVEATTYGYFPSLSASIFFTIVFGALLALCLVFGIRSRIWSYTIALAIGLALETAGYAGRILMSHNPWNGAAFQLQIIAIILAPSFIAASVYLTLKHMALHFGPQYSYLKARYYPIVFVGCDIGSIILQAIGGGIAAVAGNQGSNQLLTTGNGLIVAGISFQVFTMSIFGSLAGIFYLRYRKAGDHMSSASEGEKKRSPTVFCVAVSVAYVAILIRCIYRLPEMAGGWGNPLMRDETEFLILDGAMIVIAAFALTIIHPGFFFTAMGKRGI